MLYEIDDNEIELIKQGVGWLINYDIEGEQETAAAGKILLAKLQPVQPDAYDGRIINVQIDIETARTLAAFGECMCEVTPDAAPGSCVVCKTFDALYAATGNECYNRKDDTEDGNQEKTSSRNL